MTRDQILDRLIANCGCDEDAAALNALSTETLEGIWNARGGKGGKGKGAKAEGSNADVTGASGKTLQAGGDGEDSEDSNYADDEGDLDPDKVHPDSSKAFTGNRQLTPIQKRLTPDELEVWNEAQQSREDKMLALAQRLTTNWAGSPATRRRKIAQLLAANSLQKLREMAEYLPPVVNRRDYVQDAAPNYLGAAGGGDGHGHGRTLTDNADSDDILPLPVTNWAEAQ